MEATVLSATTPDSVVVVRNATGSSSAAELPMNRTSSSNVQGERGQVFAAKVPIPSGGEFGYYVQATWAAASASSATATTVKSPVAGLQTVVVLDIVEPA